MADALPLAVFNFELIDNSLEGEMMGARADEQRRLAMISDQLSQLLIDKGGYTIVDLAPAADAIARAGLLRGCNGCAVDIAKPLGARLALTGTVQKVSNLILNINVYVWDTESGREHYRASVDIRGNTDESWSRGVSYLVRNRLLAALAQIGAGRLSGMGSDRADPGRWMARLSCDANLLQGASHFMKNAIPITIARLTE